MTNTTQVKNYTQGYLRQEIVNRSRAWITDAKIQKDLWIWSSRTIQKRKHAESLESKSSAPLNPNRKYDFKDLYTLYAVRKYLNLNWDDALEKLEDEYKIKIGRSIWFRYMKERWLTKKEKKVVGKFKEYDPWFVHVDISYWPKLWWKKAYIYVMIDRATRLIYIEVHDNKRADTAASFLRNGIAFFPFKICKLLTDNWKEFTLKNHLGKLNLTWAFDLVCEELMIEHRTTRPYMPQTNWMVEKANDLIKVDTLKRFEYEWYDDIQKDMWQYMVYYNLYRRHWSLKKEWKGKTPYDALLFYRGKDIDIERRVSPEERRKELLDLAKKEWRKEYPKRK